MTLNNDPLAVYAWKRWRFLKARLGYEVSTGMAQSVHCKCFDHKNYGF